MKSKSKRHLGERRKKNTVPFDTIIDKLNYRKKTIKLELVLSAILAQVNLYSSNKW